MGNDLPNIKAMCKRQSTPGNLAWLFLFAYIAFPIGLDTIRKEPYIETSMVLSTDSTNRVIVEDTVKVKYRNVGHRNNRVYDKDMNIVCTASWKEMWNGVTTNYWELSSFAGCDISELPRDTYKICSTFLVESTSGIIKLFGQDDILCSNYMIMGKRT